MEFIHQCGAKSTVIFIHGFTGNKKTWLNVENETFYGLLLADDRIKNNFNVAVIPYDTNFFSFSFLQKTLSLIGIKRTGVCKNIEISELGQYLKSTIECNCDNCESVVIIAHSMGGLIAKSCILDELIETGSTKIKLFLSLAVPHNGVNWANYWNKIFDNNLQLRDLEPLSKALDHLNQNWLRAKNLPQTVYFYGLSDDVVPKQSAISLEVHQQHIIACKDDHISICKPTIQRNSYIGVKSALYRFLDEDIPSPQSTPEITIDSEKFDVPLRNDEVIRHQSVNSFRELLNDHSVISVEGLAGMGKTSLVSYVMQTYKYNFIWYKLSSGDTINDFFLDIEPKYNILGVSIREKCKKLLDILQEGNQILILNDFHIGDKSSFLKLIELAALNSGSAKIILISQTYTESIHLPQKIKRFDLKGFSEEEVKELLEKRKVPYIDNHIIELLTEKTEGLPLAISLFCMMVIDLGRTPKELLDGSIVSLVLLKEWFEKISCIMPKNQLTLLQALSLCNAAFNINVVKMFCRKLNIDESDFEHLQKKYFIRKYSKYRWSVHNLISDFSKVDLCKEDKVKMHQQLAHHFSKVYRNAKATNLSIEEKFNWMVRACRHYQSAEDQYHSEQILKEISKTTKKLGYYEIYIQLSAVQLKKYPKGDFWILYNYAHCCLITGKIRKAHKMMEPVMSKLGDVNDVNNRVALIRLFAEILNEMERPREALIILKRESANIDLKTLKEIVSHQLRQAEVMLFTALAEYSSADNLCDLLLQTCESLGNRAYAVTFTRKAIILENQGDNDTACNYLLDAIELFRKCQDQRGISWAETHLALNKIALGYKQEGLDHLVDAIKIKRDIGEWSIDYFRVLKQVEANCLQNDLMNIELSRLHETYES